MTQSPYQNISTDQWADKTQTLINAHPLSPKDIQDTALSSWEVLWQTRVGSGSTTIPLRDIDPPATVIGYFFEKLFTYKLHEKYPDDWCGSLTKEDKDVVYIKNPEFSIEIKTSGQDGTKVYGNRSYGTESTNQSLVKKEKSGYYITVNFHKNSLTLIRFGWIDYSDWTAQDSESGQMASLKQEVYESKLFAIYGDYLLNSPLFILKDIADKRSKYLESQGICKLEDLIKPPNNNSFTELIKTKRNSLDQLHNEYQLNLSAQQSIELINFYKESNLLKQVSWFIL
jgi:hypothetical protein